jgi:hypothetical protein
MEAFIWKFLYGIVFELSLQKGTNKGNLTFNVFLVWNFTLLGIFGDFFFLVIMFLVLKRSKKKLINLNQFHEMFIFNCYK